MNTSQHEDPLDQSLQSLVATHGYSKVFDHLARFEHSQSRLSEPKDADPKYSDPKYADPRYLMTLSPEERNPYLKASVDLALPAYKADLTLPEAERQLTADLETGDFYEYEEELHD